MLSEKMIILLGLLFFAVSHPMAFDYVGKFVNVQDEDGPTNMGLLLHTVVFLLLVVLLEDKVKMLPALPKLA